MSAPSKETREIWLWLLQSGGRWTAEEIARHTKLETNVVFQRVQRMAVLSLVQKFPPEPGEHKLRYGITGTCQVLAGTSVAECQAC